eukprot:jgi/Botrbrau1/21866/Bobra.0893s0002.1
MYVCVCVCVRARARYLMSPLHAVLWSVPPQDVTELRIGTTTPYAHPCTHTHTQKERGEGGHRSSAHLSGFFRAFRNCRWHPCRDWLAFPLPGSGSSFFGSSSGRPPAESRSCHVVIMDMLHPIGYMAA